MMKIYQKKNIYTKNLDINGFENNLYHVINNLKISDLGNFLYTNIDDTQEHAIMKLILAIINYNKFKNYYADFSIFI